MSKREFTELSDLSKFYREKLFAELKQFRVDYDYDSVFDEKNNLDDESTIFIVQYLEKHLPLLKNKYDIATKMYTLLFSSNASNYEEYEREFNTFSDCLPGRSEAIVSARARYIQWKKQVLKVRKIEAENINDLLKKLCDLTYENSSNNSISNSVEKNEWYMN